MIISSTYYLMELYVVKEKFNSISIDKSLATKLLIFVPIIKILILNLFPINIIGLAYGDEIISLQESNNIDGYKIDLLQLSGNPQTSRSPSGNPQASQQSPSANPQIPQQSPSANPQIPQQSPSGTEFRSPFSDTAEQLPEDLLAADPELFESLVSSGLGHEGGSSINATDINDKDIYKTNGGNKSFIMSEGSIGDDRIIGTPGTDVIIGLPGTDNIRGGNGTDVIQGNEDADRLYGENGNDIIQGGLGSDQIYGGDGDDILTGGIDDDLVIGENGNDKMYGDVGDDVLIGGSGADFFNCGDGIDVIIDFNLEEGDDRAGNCEEIFQSK